MTNDPLGVIGNTGNRFGNGLLREPREVGRKNRRRCGAASAHRQDSPGEHRPTGPGAGTSPKRMSWRLPGGRAAPLRPSHSCRHAC